MNVASLYRKLKQILNDSNTALVNKGLNTVSSLNNIPPEIEKLQINNLPYFLGEMLTEITEDYLSGCATIGERAFFDFDHITSVTIPDSVTSIGRYAFNDCPGLTSITIPDSVTSIGEYAFGNSKRFTSITIPDSVTSIEDGTFFFCTGLTSITIPDSVTSIGDYAFESCSALTSITIPDSVISIGYSAFDNTAYVNNDKNWENGVLYIGNHIVGVKNDISGSYAIKAGTLTISHFAFSDCTNLTSIIMPASIKTIGNYVLSGSTNLTDIYLNPSVPPILYRRLSIPTTTTIHVPIGSGDAYKNATNWSYLAEQIVEDIVVE